MKNKSKLQSQVFSKSTLDIVRGSKQHVYDDSGVQYLDCVNGTSHVGHCHPQVVAAGHRQMSRLVTSQVKVSVREAFNKKNHFLIDIRQ